MPSNIFANTGTNVSILFIDKGNNDENAEVMLVDASNLGEKVRDGKNQRTFLSPNEITKIEDTFINKEVVDDFSVKVTYNQIKEKNYSWSAGQYFDVKIEYVELTPDEYNDKINTYKAVLNDYFSTGEVLEQNILRSLEELKYE